MENHIQQEEIEIDIREVFCLIRVHLLLIVITGIAAAALAGIGTKCLITPQYTSTSKLYIAGKTSVVSSLSDLQLGTQLTKDYAELVQSRPVVEAVISQLGLEMEYRELLGITTISNTTDTRILAISIRHSSPETAKKIADRYAQVTAKKISEIMDVSEPKIVEEGYVEEKPSSPDLKRNILLGGILGLFLAVSIIMIHYILDDKIRSQEDIDRYLQLNTLALIPLGEEEFDGKKKKGIRRWKK